MERLLVLALPLTACIATSAGTDDSGMAPDLGDGAPRSIIDAEVDALAADGAIDVGSIDVGAIDVGAIDAELDAAPSPPDASPVEVCDEVDIELCVEGDEASVHRPALDVSGPGVAHSLSLVRHGGRALVTWSGRLEGAPERLTGAWRLVSDVGCPLGPAQGIDIDDEIATTMAGADGEGFFVGWTLVDGGSWLRRIDSDGRPLGAPQQLLPTRRAAKGQIVGALERSLVVLTVPHRDFWLVVGVDGRPLRPATPLGGEERPRTMQPTAAFGGGVFALAYAFAEPGADEWGLGVQIVDTDGFVVADTVLLAIPDSGSSAPRTVLWIGDRFLVAYARSNEVDGTANELIEVGVDGEILGPARPLGTPGLGNLRLSAISHAEGGFVAWWSSFAQQGSSMSASLHAVSGERLAGPVRLQPRRRWAFQAVATRGEQLAVFATPEGEEAGIRALSGPLFCD